MISFWVSYKLKRLSRSITAYTFRQEDKTREDYKTACNNLYFDMLQYQQEYPHISYQKIYERFVNEEMHQALKKQLQWRCFFSAAIICILLVAIGILTLRPLLNVLSQNILVSCI